MVPSTVYNFSKKVTLAKNDIKSKQNLICIPKEKNKLIGMINRKLALVGLLPMISWINPLKNIKE